MSLALLVVMAAAGYFTLDKSRNALEQAYRFTLERTAALTAAELNASRPARLQFLSDALEGARQGKAVDAEKVLDRLFTTWQVTFRPEGQQGIGSGRWKRYPVITGDDAPLPGEQAVLLEYDGWRGILAPRDPHGGQRGSLFGLILLVSFLVIAVGAGVSLWVSTQVTKPIDLLVEDVRSIARGNLHHKTRVRSGGEVGHLARQIDRMAASLEAAQDAEIELGVREREREVAGEVREAFLPGEWPEIPGYRFGGQHVDSLEPGGDFHDFVELEDRLILLVCEVSGRGVPGALVGAMARAYLKSELERGGDLGEALQKINRSIARDVRRGMYVTALVVSLDYGENTALVASAGHKLALLRYDAEEEQVRLIQPGGIALGFDRGPVFDRSLELVRVPLGAGDRLLLATTGVVQVRSPEGGELGEKRFYKLFSRSAPEEPEDLVDSLLAAAEAFADTEEYPADLTLLVVARDVDPAG